jgi:uncharacterized sulfatase
MLRPAEQLYHTAEDRYEMNNLASDAGQAERKQRLAKALEEWMVLQDDPGVNQDTQTSLQSARRGQHRYYPGR